MNRFINYTELDVWKEARKLANQIYSITKKFPSEETQGLTLMMRRIAVSIPSSISEATGYHHPEDTLGILFQGRAALYEVETMCYLALDQLYINDDDCNALVEQITVCKRLINGFINYYRKSRQSHQDRRNHPQQEENHDENPA